MPYSIFCVKRFAGKVFASVLVSTSCFAAGNFGAVVPNVLYRSAAPASAVDMRNTVGGNGIRTVIDLEDGWSDYPIEQERLWCERNGVKFHNPALSAFEKPKTVAIRKIVDMVDASEKPVLVHCIYGQDRTGLVIAAYRMIKQGWSYEDAYREMLSYGHNPSGWLGDWKTVLEEIARQGVSLP